MQTTMNQTEKNWSDSVCKRWSQVQETGQVSLPTLLHSFVACDRRRVSHAPALMDKVQHASLQWKGGNVENP